MGLMKKIRNSYLFTHLEVGKYTKRRTSNTKDFESQSPKFYEQNYIDGQYVNTASPSLDQAAANVVYGRNGVPDTGLGGNYHRYSKSLSSGLDNIKKPPYSVKEASTTPMPNIGTVKSAKEAPVGARKPRFPRGARRRSAEEEEEKKKRATIYDEEFSHAFGYDRNSIFVEPMCDFLPSSNNVPPSIQRQKSMAEIGKSVSMRNPKPVNPRLAQLKQSPASASDSTLNKPLDLTSGANSSGVNTAGSSVPRPRPRPGAGSRTAANRSTMYDPRSLSSVDYYYFSPTKGQPDARVSKSGKIAPSKSNPFDLHKNEERAQAQRPAPLSPSNSLPPLTPDFETSTTSNSPPTPRDLVMSRTRSELSRPMSSRRRVANTMYVPAASSSEIEKFEAIFSPNAGNQRAHLNPSATLPTNTVTMARSKTNTSGRSISLRDDPISMAERKHLITPILPNIDQHIHSRTTQQLYC
ncbi:hypothetical protein H4219_002173 [Mycoemilia scoparia]|uniref:Uncharacterized protein n=1 Tax=Mycoemilia scoparia TaxID=417184 RepID=A0A9W8DUE5_9FUNG|nr:hypothetical protein H4219_002173 [Mycoemilia scoparia]